MKYTNIKSHIASSNMCVGETRLIFGSEITWCAFEEDEEYYKDDELISEKKEMTSQKKLEKQAVTKESEDQIKVMKRKYMKLLFLKMLTAEDTEEINEVKARVIIKIRNLEQDFSNNKDDLEDEIKEVREQGKQSNVSDTEFMNKFAAIYDEFEKGKEEYYTEEDKEQLKEIANKIVKLFNEKSLYTSSEDITGVDKKLETLYSQRKKIHNTVKQTYEAEFKNLEYIREEQRKIITPEAGKFEDTQEERLKASLKELNKDFENDEKRIIEGGLKELKILAGKAIRKLRTKLKVENKNKNKNISKTFEEFYGLTEDELKTLLITTPLLKEKTGAPFSYQQWYES